VEVIRSQRALVRGTSMSVSWPVEVPVASVRQVVPSELASRVHARA
jgi:hypothetical protein